MLKLGGLDAEFLAAHKASLVNRHYFHTNKISRFPESVKQIGVNCGNPTAAFGTVARGIRSQATESRGALPRSVEGSETRAEETITPTSAPAERQEIVHPAGKPATRYTETKQDITVATHEYAAFLIENVVEVQANQDLRGKYAKKIGYALARGRDVTLANLFQNLTTTVGAYGLELASDDYLAAYQKLMEAGLLEDSVEPTEEFSIFISPASYTAAMKVDVFTNTDYNGAAAAIERARIGNIYGLPVYVSNLLRVPSAGQHDNAVFHRDSFALIVQEEIPMASQYLIRNLADGVVGWNLYGSARVLFPPETPGGGSAVDNRGVLVKSV